MFDFGTYPTPVELLEPLSTSTTSLWVKRDDLTSPVYGGNKVRKLACLLEDARNRGASKVVTVGAVGSHHVLATGIFARYAGMQVDAVVLRQPQSSHVLDTLRASIAQGVTLIAARSYTEAVRQLKARAAAGAYLIPAGGTNRVGSLGIVAAAAELAEQVRAGIFPEPDLIVVPLGSGGTVAGLVAGLTRAKLRTRVLAVAVTEPQRVFEHQARALIGELLHASLRPNALRRLEVQRNYLGAGYGLATEASQCAARRATQVGLTLDATYTAKAFAAALDRVALGRERHILFWHTLSSSALAPLLRGAPHESELDSEIRELAHA